MKRRGFLLTIATAFVPLPAKPAPFLPPVSVVRLGVFEAWAGWLARRLPPEREP